MKVIEGIYLGLMAWSACCLPVAAISGILEGANIMSRHNPLPFYALAGVVVGLVLLCPTMVALMAMDHFERR